MCVFETGMGMMKRILCASLAVFCIAAVARAQSTPYPMPRPDQLVPSAAEQIFALANQARAENGAGRLRWDESLAAAAREHCVRMAAEGTIAHRYNGEPDVAGRAGQAGAHFDLIEENIAVGSNAAQIHNEWMNSPGHRSNLLSPDVNRVGIAVVAVRGALYAVADYSRKVEIFTQTQVESSVADLVHSQGGVAILHDNSQARAACLTNSGVPRSSEGLTPMFVMRWQSADLSRLPSALAEKLSSGLYRRAAVGSCPARNLEGDFTAYRVAVLLY